MKLFCFGHGYTARFLTHELLPATWQYSGTNRTKRNDNDNFQFDGTAPIINAESILKDVTHLLISIAPDQNGDDLVFKHHKNIIANMPNLKWIGYLSATSVYGNHNGDWVDEETPLNPSDNRGNHRVKAEKMWLSLRNDISVNIFRLGGIYGPERNQIEKVRNGAATKLIKKGMYFSRIHVHDIGTAILKSMHASTGNNIYNIVDDEPAPASAVLDYICELMKIDYLPEVKFEEATLSPMMKSFYADNKRVKNALLKKELNWEPLFPNYRDGYQDILNKLDNGSL